MMLTHLDLFSGIGGFALAAKWAGFQTIAFCEIEPYAQRILIKNFRAVLENSDSRLSDKEKKSAEEPWRRPSNSSPVIHADIRQLDGKQFRGVTLLTAGVPCQPASCAGKRRGKEDHRWLWPEAIRILSEATPDFAIFENPRGILTLDNGMEFERLLSTMESLGYTVQPIIIPACAVDARHRRDRVWIVAHSGINRLNGRDNIRGRSDSLDKKQVAETNEQEREGRLSRLGEVDKVVADSSEQQRDRWGDGAGWWEREPQEALQIARRDGRQENGLSIPESLLGRVANGVPNRVDRLKGLGNAIVPQVAYQILKPIADLCLNENNLQGTQ